MIVIRLMNKEETKDRRKEAMMVIGIDLGTTFSATAYLDENQVPQISENAQGGRLTPSVVMEDNDGTIIVGEDAKENMKRR